MEVKICKLCRRKLPKYKEFYRPGNCADGLSSSCNECNGVGFNKLDPKLGLRRFKYDPLTYNTDKMFDEAPEYNEPEPNKEVEEVDTTMTESDIKNRDYVIYALGYDPFMTEQSSERKNLYNKLVDYLDDSTREDNFKIPIVIEIVKSFNQIDKINMALSSIPVDKMIRCVGDIKSLLQTKASTMSAILSMAKDNGISVNHSNNKSAGAGTLTGMIKQLQEKGVEAAEINLYDVETCEGMRQVADISNKSIMNQLMLNESDYTDMIREQKTMIEAFQLKVDKLEEENRLLKIRLKKLG